MATDTTRTRPRRRATSATSATSAAGPSRSANGGRGEDAAAVSQPEVAHEPRNEVRLRGRVSAPAQERVLPSGDVIVMFRVVVARPPARGAAAASARARAGEPGAARATVDTLDVVCWTAAPRRVAGRLAAGEVVEVEGALRRRFFGVAGGRASRYEVEAARVRRVSGGRRPAT